MTLKSDQITCPSPTHRQPATSRTRAAHALNSSGSPRRRRSVTLSSSAAREDCSPFSYSRPGSGKHNPPLVAFGSRVQQTKSRAPSNRASSGGLSPDPSMVSSDLARRSVRPAAAALASNTGVLKLRTPNSRTRSPAKHHHCRHSPPSNDSSCSYAKRNVEVQTMESRVHEVQEETDDRADSKKRKLPPVVNLSKYQDHGLDDEDDWDAAFDGGGCVVAHRIDQEGRSRRSSSMPPLATGLLTKFMEKPVSPDVSLDLGDDVSLSLGDDVEFVPASSDANTKFMIKGVEHVDDDDAWAELTNEASKADDSVARVAEDKTYKFNGQEFDLDENTVQQFRDVSFCHDEEMRVWSSHFSSNPLLADGPAAQILHDAREWATEYIVHQALKLHPMTPSLHTAHVPGAPARLVLKAPASCTSTAGQDIFDEIDEEGEGEGEEEGNGVGKTAGSGSSGVASGGSGLRLAMRLSPSAIDDLDAALDDIDDL